MGGEFTVCSSWPTANGNCVSGKAYSMCFFSIVLGVRIVVVVVVVVAICTIPSRSRPLCNGRVQEFARGCRMRACPESPAWSAGVSSLRETIATESAIYKFKTFYSSSCFK